MPGRDDRIDPAFSDAVRRSFVRPVDAATATEHVNAIVAAAATARADGPAPVDQPRRRTRIALLRPMFAAAAAVLVLPVGLAVAGVHLPAALEKPYDAVGISLPNQTSEQSQPPRATPAIPPTVTPGAPSPGATPAVPSPRSKGAAHRSTHSAAANKRAAARRHAAAKRRAAANREAAARRRAAAHGRGRSTTHAGSALIQPVPRGKTKGSGQAKPAPTRPRLVPKPHRTAQPGPGPQGALTRPVEKPNPR